MHKHVSYKVVPFVAVAIELDGIGVTVVGVIEGRCASVEDGIGAGENEALILSQTHIPVQTDSHTHAQLQHIKINLTIYLYLCIEVSYTHSIVAYKPWVTSIGKFNVTSLLTRRVGK